MTTVDVDEIVTQLSLYQGSPDTSDLEMKSVESFVGSPRSPGILLSTEDEQKVQVEDSGDPSKCSVCKEAAGKHSYYGSYNILLLPTLICKLGKIGLFSICFGRN